MQTPELSYELTDGEEILNTDIFLKWCLVLGIEH